MTSDEFETWRSRPFISLTLIEWIIACLVQITLIISVLLVSFGFLPSIIPETSVAAILMLVHFGIFWRGFKRTCSIRSIREIIERPERTR